MMNSSTTTHAFRLHSVELTLAVLSLLLLTLVAPAGADPGNDNRAPDLGNCQNLHVPAGTKVAFHAYARACRSTAGTARVGPSWCQRRCCSPTPGMRVKSAFTMPVQPGKASAAAKWSAWSSTAAPRTPTPSPGCCSERYSTRAVVFSTG